MEGNIGIAFRALESNRLRSTLTIAIIAVGIMSIVGIQTAIEILSDKVVGSFEKMGAGMFTVQPKSDGAGITLDQARRLSESAAEYASAISIYRYEDLIERVSSDGRSTDPIVSLISSDSQYLVCQGGTIACGRNLMESDIEKKLKVAVIGDNVRRKLFTEDGSGIGRSISCGNGRFMIVGEMERQGAIFGTGLDNSVITPISGGDNVLIDIIPREGTSLITAAERTASTLRAIRRLGTLQKPDFEIVRSNTAEDNLASVKHKLVLAALGIGLITLLGASVGLMNIMLVSVKQRTREIGLRKAVGARPSEIRRQFLVESVVIGQIGGAVGIVLGILLGNIVSLIMEGDFTIPWKWVELSVILCIVVSILSGIVPAHRAAMLDPIEALHNE